jgi:Na+/melibiose symporter-like transporter
MTATAPDAPPLGWWAKLAWSAAGTSTQVIQRGLTSILLIFYNQVVGLPPYLVSMALTIVTVFDCVLDPVFGQYSDNFVSRWGRRHPLMYLAAGPLALAYFLLWIPPHG